MANEIEVMRVLRLPPMGKLVVEVGGTRYQKITDVPAGELRRRLEAAIGELIVFAGGYQLLADAGFAPPLAVAPPAAQPTGRPAEAAPSLSLEEQQARFLQSLEKQRDMTAAAAVSRPAPNLIGSLGNLGKSAAPAAPPPPPVLEPAPADRPLTIIEQIDQILQKHLAADPRFAQRDIRMEPALNGGLRIKIDGSYYDHPGEIPEKEIQLAIKMALKEWDAS
jgi:hypothetical protein